MRLPDLESLEHFGARGAVSGRPFNPELAGGPIENLTTDGVTINREGIAIVEKHIARFGHDPVNEVMINRLKDIEKGKIPPEQVDLNFYTHECREYQRYCNLGWETGQPDGDAGYALWNHTGFAPIFPDICYHLTHYKPAATDIPVASDNPAHYADAIRYNARTPLQGSLLPLTRLVWA
ncbi:IS1 orfB [Shigella sonnei]|uniref:IS1 orfB n=1 Tax=Shigella sonnei TaxID=624 RepID=A0A8B4LFX2_SHISO|nr:IS1 orfB [Shigella sonnei]CSG57923.1 IS1 orfB [Shigella sonnei]CSG70628.1 IS1 orfB [Shigella sonnei]CSG74570.1 IS1 orfB [Shigella sonnei]CSG76202.1 IS1 orfB [Shigella sonnei]